MSPDNDVFTVDDLTALSDLAIAPLLDFAPRGRCGDDPAHE